MMTTLRLMLVVLLAAACSPQAPPPKRDLHVRAASEFTERYARSRFAGWKVRGSAAGSDCGVLLVETSMMMEESMVEALHYGAGVYGVVDGGVQQFYRERSFRGVAYKDVSGRVWTYGEVTPGEAGTLKRCD
jgi:hypothetical protein